MAHVFYDVPMVAQGPNPICWVACMAMTESFLRSASIGIGKYTGGFDPSDSCIDNPVHGAVQGPMQAYSFYPVDSDQAVNIGSVIDLLNQYGPLIYFHHITDGQPWTNAPGTNGSHAVVIEGADDSVNGGMLWVNNPWGSKDIPITASALLPIAANPASCRLSFSYGWFS
ncbi:papain-like cysteine protease family protein [Dyella silvatica]|uniref:papain-like cysteine protease family protein n=1 Tax=Dyella silvatica TaxID=2992128 RepID=UPI00225A6AF8|nr:papain-like cysteine protease family protein [Dyella silvatica]